MIYTKTCSEGQDHALPCDSGATATLCDSPDQSSGADLSSYSRWGNRPMFCLSKLFIYTLPVRGQDFSACLRLQVFWVGGVQRATRHLLKLFMPTNMKRRKGLLQQAEQKSYFLLYDVDIVTLFISVLFNATHPNTPAFIYLFIMTHFNPLIPQQIIYFFYLSLV